jgi:tetratricopeptide (TPR) repeat protein
MTDTQLLRAHTRRMVATGAWPELNALLLENESAARSNPELVRLLGEGLVRVGRAREARDWLAGTLPALQRSDDRLSLRMATVLSGAAHLELGELDPARRAFEATLELARYDRDEALVARAMNNLGIVANIEGRWDDAIALYTLATTMHQRNGDRRGLAECYHNMAITHRDRGELAQADEWERHSAEYAREAEQERLLALARLGRAEIALRRRDFALAATAARRLTAEFERLGDRIRMADAMRLEGAARAGLRQFDASRTLLDRALELSRDIGALLNIAETLRARAELGATMDDRAGTQADARAAIDAYLALGATKDAEAVERWLATQPRRE